MDEWFLNESELDDEQRNVLNLPPTASRVVYGAAGSGKTLLALWRAKEIQNLMKDSTFSLVVYTKALRRFINAGIEAVGLDKARVVHYQQWDGQNVDYIIVDEAQDFSETELLKLKGAANKAAMFFGDTAQQLYDEKKYGLPMTEKTLNIKELIDLTGYQSKELPQNYRIPLNVAKFAQYLNSENNDIISKCKNTTSITKPKILKFASWQEELDYIITQIKIRQLKDVAILVPFNQTKRTGISPEHYSVENVKNYFDQKNVDCLFKIKDEVELDFSATLPKIMTYHSSKGLQFKNVFIPHCGITWSKFKNALYVALTRTSEELIITYSDQLTYWFNKIPATYYEIK